MVKGPVNLGGASILPEHKEWAASPKWSSSGGTQQNEQRVLILLENLVGVRQGNTLIYWSRHMRGPTIEWLAFTFPFIQDNWKEKHMHAQQEVLTRPQQLHFSTLPWPAHFLNADLLARPNKKRKKLDGVARLITDPPLTSLTTLSRKKKKKKILTCHLWHVTHDTWHLTRDTWHETGGRR